MENGINYILELMKGFGLLGKYADLLVIGTSKDDEAHELYNSLKEKGLRVENRPKNNYYDFIYAPEMLRIDYNLLLTKLRQGGIILTRIPDLGYNIKVVNGRYLQINKAYGLVKNDNSRTIR